jgi:hypothetical protein
MKRSSCCHARVKELTFDTQLKKGKPFITINYGCCKCGSICTAYENYEKKGYHGRFVSHLTPKQFVSMGVAIISLLLVFLWGFILGRM